MAELDIALGKVREDIVSHEIKARRRRFLPVRPNMPMCALKKIKCKESKTVAHDVALTFVRSPSVEFPEQQDLHLGSNAERSS